MKKKYKLETTTMSLHIMAMIFMISDHLWGTNIIRGDIFTCIGRIAFPIFAFLIVEGYFHTKNLKKYILRILIFALISEIPFNLVMGSSIFYPYHQNVLWTFLIAIGLIHLNEKTKKKLWLQIITGILTVILGYFLGIITMVDFYHTGILTVLVFYFLKQRKWWSYIGQLICLWYINTEMLGGLIYEFNIFNHPITIHQQSFALLALIPIWLYKGKEGIKNKFLQYTYYIFYPLHLLILGIIKKI